LPVEIIVIGLGRYLITQRGTLSRHSERITHTQLCDDSLIPSHTIDPEL